MNTTISYQALSAHILLTAAAQAGGKVTVEDLAADLGVRMADVRRALSGLHAQGFVDITKLRLTLAGFALGKALAGRQLRSIRIPVAAVSRQASRAA